MISLHRSWRTPSSLGMALLATALLAVSGRAEDPAASLSSSFRKAAARVEGSLVSVRMPDGYAAPAPPPLVPRPGRFGLVPVPGPMADGDGPPPSTGLVLDAGTGTILAIDATTMGAPQLLVTFPDGQERLTREVRRDPRSGLCLLVVNMKGVSAKPAEWGRADALQAFDWLIAMGQPGAGDPSLSVGVFGARRRLGGEPLIETDAAIGRVGPGGILIGLDGRVVGICRPETRRVHGRAAMGYAIPADRARRVAEDLARFGRVRRGHLGITVVPSDASAFNGEAGGVRVVTVTAGSPADEAGLRQGDVILAIDHRPVVGVAGLREAVEAAAPGAELVLEIDRQGMRLELAATPRTDGQPSSTPRPARRSSTPEQPDRDAAPRPPDPPRPPGASSAGPPLSPPSPPAAPPGPSRS